MSVNLPQTYATRFFRRWMGIAVLVVRLCGFTRFFAFLKNRIIKQKKKCQRLLVIYFLPADCIMEHLNLLNLSLQEYGKDPFEKVRYGCRFVCHRKVGVWVTSQALWTYRWWHARKDGSFFVFIISWRPLLEVGRHGSKGAGGWGEGRGEKVNWDASDPLHQSTNLIWPVDSLKQLAKASLCIAKHNG